MPTPSSSTSNTDSTSLLLARAKKLINKVSAALDISSSDLPTQSSPVSNLAPLPSTNVETTGQPKQIVKCKLCLFSCGSVQSLNDHHKKDHGIVTCTICRKNFETKTSLYKHMYYHTKDHSFCCEQRGQSFPFKS